MRSTKIVQARETGNCRLIAIKDKVNLEPIESRCVCRHISSEDEVVIQRRINDSSVGFAFVCIDPLGSELAGRRVKVPNRCFRVRSLAGGSRERVGTRLRRGTSWSFLVDSSEEYIVGATRTNAIVGAEHAHNSAKEFDGWIVGLKVEWPDDLTFFRADLKAHFESFGNVGDKSNQAKRIEGSIQEPKFRVVGGVIDSNNPGTVAAFMMLLIIFVPRKVLPEFLPVAFVMTGEEVPGCDGGVARKRLRPVVSAGDWADCVLATRRNNRS